MKTYYEIDMKSNDKKITMRYLIRDNALTKVWKNLIKKILSSTTYDTNSQYQWSFVSYSESVCTEIIERMKNTAAIWNENPLSIETGKIIIPDINAKEIPYLSYVKHEELRKVLNRLHEMFHSFAEKTKKTGFSELDQLNKDIHALETQVISAVSDQYKRRTSSSFFLSGDFKKEVLIGTDYSLYDFFHREIGESRTGLFLGYHTIGKDIRNCFMDNDVELVKNGMVRPQITISTECLCNFEESAETNKKSSNSILLEVEKWIVDNDLQSYIDMNLPCNRVTDRPRIGDLITNIEFDEIYDMMSSDDFKIIDCRLIEE